MADDNTVKPDDKAKTTETDQADAGVTIRSTDPADDAPTVELTETDEERVTREAAEAGAAGDETHEDDADAADDAAAAAAADETTETDETETDEERAAKAAEGDDQPKPKRKRPRAQERINEALRDKYRSDARAAAFEKENEELKAAAASTAKPAAEPGKKDETPDKTPPRPVQDEFDGTYEEFLQADTKWQIEQGLKASRADIREEILSEIKADRDQESADAQLQAEQDAVAAYSQRIDETRAAHPDFNDVIEQSGDVPISPPMREALIATPLAGDLLYHFAKNPALCAEIAEMPASQALVAMGRLEQQLETAAGGAPGAQATTTTARAKRRLPKPVTPVRGSTATATVKPDEMPYQQYKDYREKQERATSGR